MSRPATAEPRGHDSALHNVEAATRPWPFLLALVLQNLAIFRAHYFSGAGFPWDFSMAYYAMVAFWTAAVGGGTFPQWMPFQQMGYPFALQLQSGMNYLPLWAFPLFRIPYTLHAAVVFQCLHILFGSVGMFVLARMEQRSSAFAIVAAVAFQFFGGFYSNAEHVDIIRAFAVAPWLLYVFTLDRRDPERLPTRSILIPPIVYLFAAGGYPGNVFAGGVIVAIYLALQLADVHRRGCAPSRLTRVALSVAGLTLLGCGMAILQYGPVWLHRTEFVRAAGLGATPREGLWFPHLAGLFLSNKTLPGEISMTSTYVSLPVVIFATFAPVRALERNRVLLILGGVAMLMAAGDRSFLWAGVTTLIPVLKLSRFPSSDYRVFVAIPLILIAVAGLRAIVEKQLSGTTIAVRSLVCVTWLCWGLAHVYHSMGREVALAVVVAAASFATLIALWRTPSRFMPIGLCAVVLLISADALRVLPDVPGWHEAEFDAWYARQGFPPYKTPRGRLLSASRILSNLPASRPVRTVPAGLVRWGGYVDGRFLTNDLTPNVLRATDRVGANSLYQKYMLMEWRPLLLEAPETRQPPEIVVPDTALAERIGNISAIEREGVKQIRYGVNEIRYQVSLVRAQLLVENEMYFPGWHARLSTPDGATLDAVSVNGVFRSWFLPAGTYTMDASFEFPRRSGLWLVTILSVLLWMSVVLVRWRGARALQPTRWRHSPHR
jgi:hypothetical protein